MDNFRIEIGAAKNKGYTIKTFTYGEGSNHYIALDKEDLKYIIECILEENVDL